MRDMGPPCSCDGHVRLKSRVLKQARDFRHSIDRLASRDICHECVAWNILVAASCPTAARLAIPTDTVNVGTGLPYLGCILAWSGSRIPGRTERSELNKSCLQDHELLAGKSSKKDYGRPASSVMLTVTARSETGLMPPKRTSQGRSSGYKPSKPRKIRVNVQTARMVSSMTSRNSSHAQWATYSIIVILDHSQDGFSAIRPDLFLNTPGRPDPMDTTPQADIYKIIPAKVWRYTGSIKNNDISSVTLFQYDIYFLGA